MFHLKAQRVHFNSPLRGAQRTQRKRNEMGIFGPPLRQVTAKEKLAMITGKAGNDDELIYIGKDRHFNDAQQRLRNVQHAYYTAVASVRLLATNPDLGSAIAIQGILRKGLKGKIDHQKLLDVSELISEYAASQLASDFQDYRHFAIVGICSALEYSLKSLFIDFVQCKKLSLDRFSDKSINVNAWDFVSLDRDEDRLSLLADKFYQDASAKKSAFDKFKYYLSEVIACPGSEWKGVIAKVDVDDFNEAYLVRNCVVHHGARVNSLLGKKSGFKIGEKIFVNEEMLGDYFSAIHAMGDSLSAAAINLENV